MSLTFDPRWVYIEGCFSLSHDHLYMITSIYRLVYLSLNPCTVRIPHPLPNGNG